MNTACRTGRKRYPAFVLNYEIMSVRLTPRWGGTLEGFVAFADSAVKGTEAAEGKALYAWLYEDYAKVENDQSFIEMGIPWPAMKAGFEELQKRYPSSINLNKYAYYACQANDKATFLALLPRITPETYRENLWGKSFTLESCRATFTSKT